MTPSIPSSGCQSAFDTVRPCIYQIDRSCRHALVLKLELFLGLFRWNQRRRRRRCHLNNIRAAYQSPSSSNPTDAPLHSPVRSCKTGNLCISANRHPEANLDSLLRRFQRMLPPPGIRLEPTLHRRLLHSHSDRHRLDPDLAPLRGLDHSVTLQWGQPGNEANSLRGVRQFRKCAISPRDSKLSDLRERFRIVQKHPSRSTASKN